MKRSRYCIKCGYKYTKKKPERKVYCFHIKDDDHYMMCQDCMKTIGVTSEPAASNERWAEAYGYEPLI